MILILWALTPILRTTGWQFLGSLWKQISIPQTTLLLQTSESLDSHSLSSVIFSALFLLPSPAPQKLLWPEPSHSWFLLGIPLLPLPLPCRPVFSQSVLCSRLDFFPFILASSNTKFHSFLCRSQLLGCYLTCCDDCPSHDTVAFYKKRMSTQMSL